MWATLATGAIMRARAHGFKSCQRGKLTKFRQEQAAEN
jgi:hypothetical protein